MRREIFGKSRGDKMKKGVVGIAFTPDGKIEYVVA